MLTSHQDCRRTHRLPSWQQILSAAVLLLLIAEISTSEEYDYCGVESITCQRGTHTMCLSKKDGPGQYCAKYESVKLRRSEIAAILNKHNELRNNIALGKVWPFKKAANMMELSWDEELAMVAQRWADQCTYDHDLCRELPHRGFWGVGQNLAYSWEPEDPALFKSAENRVQAWYDEVEDYHYESGPYKFNKKTGHFTQVVWGSTKLIGCGRSRWYFGNCYHQLLVCNYMPSGNVQTYHLYKEGEPCSECICSARYPGLCASDGTNNNNFSNALSSSEEEFPTYPGMTTYTPYSTNIAYSEAMPFSHAEAEDDYSTELPKLDRRTRKLYRELTQVLGKGNVIIKRD